MGHFPEITLIQWRFLTLGFVSLRLFSLLSRSIIGGGGIGLIIIPIGTLGITEDLGLIGILGTVRAGMVRVGTVRVGTVPAGMARVGMVPVGTARLIIL